jgi:hypothetical protein
MSPRKDRKINGKLYIFVADSGEKQKLTKYVGQLKIAGYLVRVEKITNDTKGLPPDGLKAYKKDFPHGRWGVWARPKSGWKK